MDWDVLDRLQKMGGDTLVREVIGPFLEDTPKRLAALEAALDDGDREALMEEAERLRRSAMALGDDRLAAMVHSIALGAPFLEATHLSNSVDALGRAFAERLAVARAALGATPRPPRLAFLAEPGSAPGPLISRLATRCDLFLVSDLALVVEAVAAGEIEGIVVTFPLGAVDPLRVASTVRGVEGGAQIALFALAPVDARHPPKFYLDLGFDRCFPLPLADDEALATFLERSLQPRIDRGTAVSPPHSTTPHRSPPR